MTKSFISRCFGGLAAMLCATHLHATVFEVTIDTTPLALTDATLVFDLLSGDAGPSTLTISDFTGTGATLGDAFFVYDLGVPLLAPTLAGTVTLNESGTFLSEYQQHLTFGTSLTFRFSTTGTAPGDPLTPDSVSFFVLDADALQSLVTTDAVGDTQAIFRYDIGSEGAPDVSAIIGPEGAGVRVAEVTTAAPEPTTALLLLGGMLMLPAVQMRRTRSRPPGARSSPLPVDRRTR